MKLRRDICLGTLQGLPPNSKGHHARLEDQLAHVKACGFESVVAWEHWDKIRDADLTAVGMGRVLAPADALALAQHHADEELDFTTLHVGTGFETDEEMDRLAEAVTYASERTGHPLHVETHRATMTQDIFRTVQLAQRHDELVFTLDFSHWYTGHEMTYGGEFEARLARLAPVFARVGSLQLRFGDTGRIQRPLAPAGPWIDDHLKALKTCLTTLSRSPGAPRQISIAPELLGARMGTGREERWICYSEDDESHDRFADALAFSDLVQSHCV